MEKAEFLMISRDKVAESITSPFPSVHSMQFLILPLSHNIDLNGVSCCFSHDNFAD